MLAERQLSEFELAQLASLNPGEVDEARALVPSLQVSALHVQHAKLFASVHFGYNWICCFSAARGQLFMPGTVLQTLFWVGGFIYYHTSLKHCSTNMRFP